MTERSVETKVPMDDPPQFDIPTGWDVWRWPEFQAFARRLGIPLDRPTVDLNIYLPLEEAVTITEEYRGDQLFNARRRKGTQSQVETTSVQNEQFKTFRPLPNDRPAVEAGLHGLPFNREEADG